MSAVLLPKQELLSKNFINFLLHQHPECRTTISNWIVQAKGLQSYQSFELFLQTIPERVLKAVQEAYIKQKANGSAASEPAASPAAGAAMASQQPRPAGQQAAQIQATAAHQAAMRGAIHNMGAGAGQQFQAGNTAWPAQVAMQQQQQRTVSPVPGHQAGTAAALQQQLHLQQLQQQHQLQAAMLAASKAPAGQQQILMYGANQYINPAAAAANPALMAQLQQQLRNQQQQQQAAQAKRTGPPPPAAPRKQAGSLPASTSGGNLAALLAGDGAAGQQRGAAALKVPGMPNQVYPAAAAVNRGLTPGSNLPGISGMRPAILPAVAGTVPGAAGLSARPLGPAGVTAAGAPVGAAAQQQLGAIPPGAQPRLDPPEGHEWMHCANKDGTTGWYAVPRAKAQALRAALKRRAEAQAGGPNKQQAAGAPGAMLRRRIDDDVTAGADMNVLDVMGAEDLQAELALNEAAKGAVVVEQGNVQEEYILNLANTMSLVARAAKRTGVKAVGEDVYAYLSLAIEAHLAQLLHNLVKVRLQREDLGKGYRGVQKVDDKTRAGLFNIQKREKEAARKREEEERDELARLGASRKKLGDEDRKAAKAAKDARQLEQQQKNLGSTLTKMGIGRRNFGMSALGRPAGAGAGGVKLGFTKPELQEVKEAAVAPNSGIQAAAAGAAAATANGVGDDADAAGSPAIKAEPGTNILADGLSSQQQPAAAPVPGPSGATVPPIKPMSLQHQLLNVASQSQASTPASGVPPFVAGHASSGRDRDGEEGLREVMLADLIAVLERHPLYCRSQQLFSLYALAGQPNR
eukprot:GHRR01001705.1.p1 GENE.GHRR01001705.1~~GHRR01001705.1.p1  ORF type:complete len:804 (+),score=378.70 GHRR01001705.1:1329-3740(+)